jgi:hypothetical protein
MPKAYRWGKKKVNEPLAQCKFMLESAAKSYPNCSISLGQNLKFGPTFMMSETLSKDYSAP